MFYPIKQEFITGHNRPGTALKPIGLVVHCTDSPGATAEAERSYFQNTDRDASAHAFVDWDGIVQTIPWNERAWHAGAAANNRFIGIELCEPKTKNNKEVWNRAAWLFAYLFVNVTKVNTITVDKLMSHDEVSKKWHETNHTDPVAYFAQYGKTVNNFRAAVQAEINSMLAGGKSKVKNLVVYGKKEDKAAAEMLAYRLGCPVMDADIAFDYSAIENVYCVGAPGAKPFTSYAKAIITGADRIDTMQKVLNFKVA